MHTLTCPSPANFDELLPVEGKDEIYDGIQAEIDALEQKLDDELRDFSKKHKYALFIGRGGIEI